jgi:hypothetical protein
MLAKLKGYRTYLVLAVSILTTLSGTVCHCTQKPAAPAVPPQAVTLPGGIKATITADQPAAGVDWPLWLGIAGAAAASAGIAFRHLAEKRFRDFATDVSNMLAQVSNDLPAGHPAKARLRSLYNFVQVFLGSPPAPPLVTPLQPFNPDPPATS